MLLMMVGCINCESGLNGKERKNVTCSLGGEWGHLPI